MGKVLEEGIATASQEAFVKKSAEGISAEFVVSLSIAISLKRIADALERANDLREGA